MAKKKFRERICDDHDRKMVLPNDTNTLEQPDGRQNLMHFGWIIVAAIAAQSIPIEIVVTPPQINFFQAANSLREMW